MVTRTVRLTNLFVLLLLLRGGWTAAAEQATGGAETARRHPLLVCSLEGLQRARMRVRDEAWAKQWFGRIADSAKQLEQEPLPVFDRQWWQVAGKKRWQDIYPEVHRYAGAGVGGPMRQSPDAAIAYALSGDRRYAETVRKILLHYATYEFEARHPDVGMTWGGWGMAGLRAYDLVYDTLDARDRRVIDGFFERAVAAVMSNDRDWIRENYGGRFNNHYAHHNLFIGAYGVFYGKPEYVDYALESEQGFRALIENAGLDDGLWFESSLHYHFTGVGPIAQFATILANANHPFDLWNHAFAKGRRLGDFFTAPIATLFPDESLPTVGDAYGRRGGIGSVQACFEAYDALADRRLGWALRNAELPAGAIFLRRLPANGDQPPEMETRVWPEHGYVALRSQEGTDYWRGEGYSAFLSFDQNAVHSHRDKLGLMVYGRGAHLALDPEAVASVPHAFSSRVQNELNRETLCHNTLMVDGRSHAWLNEKLVVSRFADTPDCKTVTLSDPDGLVYKGVRLSRTVSVTADYVLDVFQATSAKDHTYDYLFHAYDDQGEFEIAGDFEPARLPSGAPWSWLRNARQASLDAPWSATSRQGSLQSRLSVAGEAGTRVITCSFPRTDTFAEPPIPMLMVRRTARSAEFACVLQAERHGLPPTSISLERGTGDVLQITVDCGGKTRRFAIPAVPRFQTSPEGDRPG